MIALSMIPPLQFTYWQWLALTLAAPVAVWGAWPFHRAALANLRHRAATMDTLISMGVLAAFAWSVYALFLGGAGHEGLHHGFSLTIARGSAGENIYLEVASGLTAVILTGRFFEARAKRRAGSALRALLADGRQGRRRPAGRRRSCASRSTSSVSATGSSCGRARRSPPTASSRTARRRSTPACSPGNRCPSRSARAIRSSGPRSTPAAGWSCGRPASAPTLSWRRWPSWSPTPRTARPTSSGSPTGSRRCSCRS